MEVEEDEHEVEMEQEEERRGIDRESSISSVDFQQQQKKKIQVFQKTKMILTLTFPYTGIYISVVLLVLVLPLVVAFCVLYLQFPDLEGGDVEIWKWILFALIMVAAWVGGYIVSGFLCGMSERLFPRSQFTYFFVELRHSLAYVIVGIIGGITTSIFLQDFSEKEYLVRGWISIVVVAVCYGLRMMVERYTLLKFARNEYFHSLKKLMFQEKIVFKLLAYRLEYEKSKLESRKLNGNDGENGQFQSLSPEEISPDVKLITGDGVTHPKTKWVSPTEKDEPPDIFMLYQCEKYSNSRRFSFLNYGKERDRLINISNENLKQQYLSEEIQNVTELIFKALQGHHKPITVASFAVIFPEKRHRRQAAFSVFSGGPLDIIIGKSQIKTTVTRVFEARHNASASLEGRGAVAKVLSACVGIFFWSIMLVIVLLIFGVDVVSVVVPYTLLIISFSFAFGTSIQNVIQAAIFLLVIHPFDVGDRIVVDGGDTMVVKDFSLVQTVAYRPDGRWVSFPNAQLFAATIQNYHRSKSYTINIYIEVEPDTDQAVLEELIADTCELCENHETYLPNPEVLVDSIGHGNTLKMNFWVETKLVPWYNVDLNVIIKTNFIFWVMGKLKEKNIKYKEPILPVNVKTKGGRSSSLMQK